VNYSRSMAIEYDPMTDHYVALGVGSMASHDEIKKAHRALIRELHPDCGGDAVPAAQVNIARDVLLDPVTREEYDRAQENVAGDIHLRRSPGPGHAGGVRPCAPRMARAESSH